MKTKFIIFLSLILLFSSCNKFGSSLPSVSGTKYEILVVMDDAQWKATPGRSLVTLLDQDMECLPQAEAVTRILHCKQVDFTDMMKPARNILLTEISAKFNAPKIIYTQNKWAQPQSVVLIQAPNDSVFASTIKTYGDNILNYYLRTERDRQIEFNKTNTNEVAKAEIEKQFGIQIDIQQGMNKSLKKKDFYWITNNNPNIRQDIVIYSYPYTDKKTFTKEFLLAKRDSILKADLPGEVDGSYMGTEYKYVKPVFKEIWVNERYCAEMRGLWKMINGGIMGGPFYSQTRLDEINKKVITIEGFVFAPGEKKRNPLRQLEAIVYSAKFPQDINALKEVSVVAKKKIRL